MTAAPIYPCPTWASQFATGAPSSGQTLDRAGGRAFQRFRGRPGRLPPFAGELCSQPGVFSRSRFRPGWPRKFFTAPTFFRVFLSFRAGTVGRHFFCSRPGRRGWFPRRRERNARGFLFGPRDYSAGLAAGNSCPSERNPMIVDTCDNCGLPLDDASHFAVGKTWCRKCWSGRRPPVAMPPTPAQRKQLNLWCAPKAKPRAADLVGRILP